MQIYTEADARKLLKLAIKAAGSQDAFAALHGLTQSHISRVLAGGNGFGKKMQEACGIVRVYILADEKWIPTAQQSFTKEEVLTILAEALGRQKKVQGTSI